MGRRRLYRLSTQTGRRRLYRLSPLLENHHRLIPSGRRVLTNHHRLSPTDRRRYLMKNHQYRLSTTKGRRRLYRLSAFLESIRMNHLRLGPTDRRRRLLKTH